MLFSQIALFIPFALVVLSVALLPALAPRVWRNRRALILSIIALPVVLYMGKTNVGVLATSFVDYLSFLTLLWALYTIGGGLFVSGTPKANPVTNLGYMIAGAIGANLIGTIGASMLLIRPLLRSNRGRKREVHVVMFFIFIVSTAGGLLSPLASSPLFVGYLKGVPFFWFIKLFPIWFFVITWLLGVFVAVDAYLFLNDPDFRGPLKSETKEPLKITGRWNLALIPLVGLAVLLPQILGEKHDAWRSPARLALLLLVVHISRKITPKQIHQSNNFSWEPFRETAVIYLALFATMLPAVKFLESSSSALGLNTTWDLFWLSGGLAGVFGNFVSFVVSFALAQGLGSDYAMIKLASGQMISEPLLTAICCGTAFLGSITYIGNPPSLLVKGVAQEENVKMPSFFEYILWSSGILLPILALTATLFFRD